MKVLSLGESVIDQVTIDGTEISERHIGGTVLSAAILLSRLGVDCTLMTSLGTDEEGNLIKRNLSLEKVKLIVKSQTHTKVNYISVNDKNGKRIKTRGEIIHSKISNLDKKLIESFDLIIIDRHEQEAFYEILEKKKISAKIIIDPSTEVSGFTKDMIRFAHYPIIPIETLGRFESKELKMNLKRIYQTTKKDIIVTAGEHGSLVYDGVKILHIPGFSVNALDVTGAGDVYRGAFAYGVINNKPLLECVNFANLISALQCTKLGNVAAIPTLKEIKTASRSIIQDKKTRMAVGKFFEKGMSV